MPLFLDDEVVKLLALLDFLLDSLDDRSKVGIVLFDTID